MQSTGLYNTRTQELVNLIHQIDKFVPINNEIIEAHKAENKKRCCPKKQDKLFLET
jgi:hypothetical protein